MRPQQTSRGTERPREASSEDGDGDALQKMRDENMQLKIDVEVRKQLLNQAAGEITRQRDHIEGLLRENGALQSRVLQLSAPAQRDQQELPPPERVQEATDLHYPQPSFGNPAASDNPAL